MLWHLAGSGYHFSEQPSADTSRLERLSTLRVWAIAAPTAYKVAADQELLVNSLSLR